MPCDFGRSKFLHLITYLSGTDYEGNFSSMPTRKVYVKIFLTILHNWVLEKAEWTLRNSILTIFLLIKSDTSCQFGKVNTMSPDPQMRLPCLIGVYLYLFRSRWTLFAKLTASFGPPRNSCVSNFGTWKGGNGFQKKNKKRICDLFEKFWFWQIGFVIMVTWFGLKTMHARLVN